MLQELAETGYAGTELGDWGYMPVETPVTQTFVGAMGFIIARSICAGRAVGFG